MMDSPNAHAPRTENWSLLLGASLVLAFSAVGFLVQTFGVFSAAIEAEFGGSRTATYSLLAVATLLAPVFIPLTGWAADRLRLRTLVLCALAVQFVCLLMIGLAPVGQVGFAAFFLITYVASFGASSVPLAKVVSAEFELRRGAALGILFAGACVGAIVNPLIAGALLTVLGWQGAFAVLGVQVAVFAGIPALVLIRPRSKLVAIPLDAANSSGWRLLFRSRALFVILGWAFFAALGYGGLQGHLVPLLEERGHGASGAIVAQSLMGVGLLVGNLTAGLLLDRIPTRWLASLMLLLPTVGLVAIVAMPSGPADTVFTTAIGIATGTETAMLAYAVARYLPAEVGGRGLAVAMVAVAVGAGVSTLLGAITHDITGSYQLFLLACAASLIVAAVCPWGLREPLATSQGKRSSSGEGLSAQR